MATVIKHGLEFAASSLAASMAASRDKFVEAGSTLGAINGGLHFATAKAIEADRKPLLVQLSLPFVTCAATTLMSKAVFSSQENLEGVYVFSATALSVVTLAKFLFQKLRNELPAVKDESYLMRLFNYSVVSVGAFIPSAIGGVFLGDGVFRLERNETFIVMGLIYGVVQVAAHKLCGSSKESLITKIASQVIGSLFVIAAATGFSIGRELEPFVIITGVSLVTGAVATLAMHYFKSSSKGQEEITVEKNELGSPSSHNYSRGGAVRVEKRGEWSRSPSGAWTQK